MSHGAGSLPPGLQPEHALASSLWTLSWSAILLPGAVKQAVANPARASQEIIAALLLSDAISGAIHFALDQLDVTAASTENLPELLVRAAALFQEHHQDPLNVCRRSELDVFGDGALGAAASTLPFLASLPLHNCRCAVLTMLLAGSFSQVIHRHAHLRTHLLPRSGVLDLLQDCGVLLRSDEHRAHHLDPSRHFCIINGWANGAFDAALRAVGQEQGPPSDEAGLPGWPENVTIRGDARAIAPRRVHGALLQLLRALDGSGVDYFVCGGTMLGMARHRGFIPWDDDADVSVPLCDYRRALDALRGLEGVEVAEVVYGAQAWLRSDPSSLLDIYPVAPWSDMEGRWCFAAPLVGDPATKPTYGTHLIFPAQSYCHDAVFPTALYPFEDGVLRGPRRLHDVCRSAYGADCLEVAVPPPWTPFAHGSEDGKLLLRSALWICQVYYRASPPEELEASMLAVGMAALVKLSAGQSAAFLDDEAWWRAARLVRKPART